MAIFDSDVAAKQIDPTAKNRDGSGQVGAHTIPFECIITVDAAMAANDLVRLFFVNENIRLIPGSFSISTDGVGATTATVDIGTLTNSDEIAAALNINAAGYKTAAQTGDAALAPSTVSLGEFYFLKFATLTGTATADRVIVVRGLGQRV